MEKHKEKILALKDGERYEYSDDDFYTGLAVVRVYNVFVLFALSEGCDPSYASTYPKWRIDALIKEVEGWT